MSDLTDKLKARLAKREGCQDYLHALLLGCVEALEMGAFHHDACPWLRGGECCCAHDKVYRALTRLTEALKDDGDGK